MEPKEQLEYMRWRLKDPVKLWPDERRFSFFDLLTEPKIIEGIQQHRLPMHSNLKSVTSGHEDLDIMINGLSCNPFLFIFWVNYKPWWERWEARYYHCIHYNCRHQLLTGRGWPELVFVFALLSLCQTAAQTPPGRVCKYPVSANHVKQMGRALWKCRNSEVNKTAANVRS